MEARRTIRLSFDAASHETVEVTDVAPGQVRLHDTPLLAEPLLAPGDVIQVEEGPDGVCRFERLHRAWWTPDSQLEHQSRAG